MNKEEEFENALREFLETLEEKWNEFPYDTNYYHPPFLDKPITLYNYETNTYYKLYSKIVDGRVRFYAEKLGDEEQK
jgi:hypothetical protein